MSNLSSSMVVEETLSRADIHDGWEDSYRNPENEKFYDLAFDMVAREVGQPGTRFLDVGCGSCSHSIRLAQRGYQVCAVDFSQPVIERARHTIASAGMADKIEVERQDILDMTFDDQTFDQVMCWGVLMHIPDYERAISEMDRVLRKGGKLVFSEGNVFSLHSIVMRNLKKLFGKPKRTRWTAAGFETWECTDSGELMTRQANMGWMQQELQSRGYKIRKRAPGELTEIYKEFHSPPIRKMFHALNRFWFRVIGLPSPALGNILIAEKTGRTRPRPK